MKEFAYIHDEGATPAALQTVPLFKTFSEEQLDDVLNSSNLLQCDVGDAIIQEGTIDSRIYILLSGTLEVRVGGKHVANIARSGEVFGELALVNQDKRLASVVAATKAVCLAVDQKFLQDIHPRDEDPAFYAALYEFVARLIAKKLDATSRYLAGVEKELRAEGQPGWQTESQACPCQGHNRSQKRGQISAQGRPRQAQSRAPPCGPETVKARAVHRSSFKSSPF